MSQCFGCDLASCSGTRVGVGTLVHPYALAPLLWGCQRADKDLERAFSCCSPGFSFLYAG